jgi:glycosyltransferase involved in cell wall biosynthesis
MIELSVIIPTRNRADYLKDALESVLNQTLNKDIYEIIVIDNGSTDNTREVVEQLNQLHQKRIRYFYEPTPGLHVGRHLGAKESRSDILVYTDDDIIAFPEWLKAVRSAFSDPKVALVGGKILPRWEGEVPDWVALFKDTDQYGWSNGYLSILDFGDKRQEIPAFYVYGCNFSIRKSVMYECGGFHPDSMPQELIRFRGDGETGLATAIMEKGYKTIYEPKAAVYHRVPPERLTLEYFCRRAFNQGVSDSYTQIRKYKGLDIPQPKIHLNLSLLKGLKDWAKQVAFNRKQARKEKTNLILAKVQQSYKDGRRYHREQVASDLELLAFVLREHYY